MRSFAVSAFSRIGMRSEAAIVALIERLEDQKKYIRWNVVFTLLRLDPKRIEVLPVLIEILEEGNIYRKTSAASALGRIGPAARDAIPALEQARKSAASMSREDSNLPSSVVKRLQVAAADALKKIRGEISR